MLKGDLPLKITVLLPTAEVFLCNDVFNITFLNWYELIVYFLWKILTRRYILYSSYKTSTMSYLSRPHLSKNAMRRITSLNFFRSIIVMHISFITNNRNVTKRYWNQWLAILNYVENVTAFLIPRLIFYTRHQLEMQFLDSRKNFCTHYSGWVSCLISFVWSSQSCY